MKEAKHIHFVIDRFELGLPGQQLLDRFLIGYTRNGVFLKPPMRTISARVENENELLQKRVTDHGLKIGRDASSADAIVAVNASNLLGVVQEAKNAEGIFVYGVIGRSRNEYAEITKLSGSGKRRFLSGAETGTALRLPELKIGSAREALIVTQGERAGAELLALDGVLSFFERPPQIRRARFLEKDAVWAAAGRKEWSWDLLRAALSRTDSPQGNALIDGRTEDMAQLGLVQRYATRPWGWLLEHENGMRTTLLFLDGVIGDTVAAFRTGDGIRSTQLFRAPAPMHAEFDRLVAVMEDFFATGKRPWSSERSWIETVAISHFARAESKSGDWVDLVQ